MAIAPPLTLILPWSISNACMKRSTTEANASLSSNRSISDSCMPARLSLLGHVHRTGEHDRRLRANIGERLDLGARLQPAGFAGLFVADQHGGGAVDKAGRIAGVMDVIDELYLRMFLGRDRVEPALFAYHHE